MIDQKTLELVRFCAIECKLQGSGELSVSWMLSAWDYAQRHATTRPTIDDILKLGQIIEPKKNVGGFRKCGVRVGWDVKMDWERVPEQMAKLVENQEGMTPGEFCREYLEVHPWRDGNGRSSQILFAWLSGTLDNPDWHEDWWSDPRRTPGHGAPQNPTHDGI